MAKSSSRQRRLHMLADQEGYGPRLDDRQDALQRAMLDIFDKAAHEAVVDRPSWKRQPGGDSELARFPAHTDDARVLADLVRELDTGLGDYNRPLQRHERLRLRVAFVHGFSASGANGWVGQAPVRAARLADAPVTKDVLARTEDANLVVVIDRQLFDDVVTQRRRGLCPEKWARVRVKLKELDESAYIYVPRHSPRDLGAGHTSAARVPPPVSGHAAESDQRSPRPNVTASGHHSIAAGHDVKIGPQSVRQ